MNKAFERTKKRLVLAVVLAVAVSLGSLGVATGLFIQSQELASQVGVPGEAGTCGVPGVDGADGADGECGPQGDVGPCGPQGEAGLPGEPGSEGEAGATGAQGEKGDTGATGAQGEKGDTGATGAQGEKGDTGATGAQGEQGPEGEKGETGEQGAPGLTTLGHWGSFWNTTSQSNDTAEPRAMRLNAADPDNCGVSVKNGSQITVTRSGTYNLQFSAQVKTTQNNTKPIDIWLAKNGGAVEDTNTQFFTPDRKGIIVASWNFVVTLDAGDYVELMWYSEDTNLYLSNLGPQEDLGIPAVPSLIVTLTQVG